jgi:ribosomal protein L29
MSKKIVSEYRNVSVPQLKKVRLDLEKSLLALRVNLATGQLDQTHSISDVKTRVAIVNTLIVESGGVDA